MAVDTKSRRASGIASASIGTLLLVIARKLPFEPETVGVLVLLIPSLAIFVHSLLNSVQDRIMFRRNRSKVMNHIIALEQILKRQIRDTFLNPAEQDNARRQYSVLMRHRVELERSAMNLLAVGPELNFEEFRDSIESEASGSQWSGPSST